MGGKRIIAFDIEADYDSELNVESLGAHNYLAATDVYSIAFFGEGISWVGDPAEADWSQFQDCELWSHNRLFDQAYLQVYGIPDPGGNCTSNLSRYLCGEYSLARAAERLLSVQVDKGLREGMKGRRFRDLPPEEQARVRAYNLRDAELCYRLALLRERWPEKEQRLSLLTLRMCARGVCIDRPYLEWGIKRMYTVMAEAGAAIPWLRGTRLEVDPWGEARMVDLNGRAAVVDSSSDKESYLAILGLPVPSSYDYNKPDILRWGETRGPGGLSYREMAPAIEQVRRYKRANIKLTRLLKLRAWIKPDGRVSLDVMYMGVSHTGRWLAKTLDAGSDKVSGINAQNFDNEEFEGLAMRKLIVAAPGYKFIDCDASAIEPRILARLTGQWKIIAAFREGFNTYEAYALGWKTWQGEPNTFKKSDPRRYKATKMAVLGCGYAVGAEKFRSTVRVREGRELSLEEAQTIIAAYRKSNPEVVAYWKHWEGEIREAWASHIPRTLTVTLASGRKLCYENFEKVPNSTPWKFDYFGLVGGRRRKLYGGSLTENIVQSTARDAFGEMILRAEEAGYVPVLLIHDELLSEVPADSELTEAGLETIFRAPIPWLPGLALDAEGRECVTYADSETESGETPILPPLSATIVYRTSGHFKNRAKKGSANGGDCSGYGLSQRAVEKLHDAAREAGNEMTASRLDWLSEIARFEPTVGLERKYKWVGQRHAIWEYRQWGVPPAEWNGNIDPYLLANSFCNVWRVLDGISRRTVTIARNAKSFDEQLAQVLMLKTFNEWETYEALCEILGGTPTTDNLDADRGWDELHKARKAGRIKRLWRPAYTSGGKGLETRFRSAVARVKEGRAG